MSTGNEVEASKLSFNEVQERRDAEEKVMYFTNQYQAASIANQPERALCLASNDLYTGVQNKHWTQANLEYLRSMERSSGTYNFAKVEADKVIGQVINNPHNSKFAAINQEDVTKTNIVDSLYEYDANRGKYKKVWNQFVKDTIIHTGVMEMYVDYRHSRLGNISRRTLNRVSECEWSSTWQSGDMEDLEVFYKTTWKTARQLKDDWKTKSDAIDQAINYREELTGDNSTEEDIHTALFQGDLYVDTNGRYKVIEACYMQKVAKTKRNEKVIAEFKENNANPDTSILQDNSPIVAPEYTSICKIITFAPGVGVGLVLQEGEHPVQVGKLPYYVASADITNGVRQGIVSGMIDAQLALNKKVSMQMGNQISSSNGGLLVSDELFEDDEVMEDFKANRTKTGATFKTASGIGRITDHIAPIPTSPMPPDLQASIDWTQNFLSIYPNNTDAISGNSGGANESGVLFESKKGQAKVAHAGLVGVFEDIKDQDAEDYFLLHKVVYKGPRREMRSATGDKIDINRKVAPALEQAVKAKMPSATVNYYLAGVPVGSAGEADVVIFNEIAKLPRHNVIIKKSELGLDQKQQTLSLFFEMSQRSKNPISQSIYEGAMAPLLEVTPDVAERLKLAAEINFELQISQTKGNIIAINAQNAQAELTTLQSQMQVQQMQAQMQNPKAPNIPPEESAADNEVGDSRTVANGPGQGNLPDPIASDASGTNNKSASDG